MSEKRYKGTVSIMRSYDYSHFEISLSAADDVDPNMTTEQIDEMRKDAMRLADKAVKQYKIARERERMKNNGDSFDHKELERRVKIITENTPKSEYIPEQIATIKELADFDYALEHDYDYEDEEQ